MNPKPMVTADVPSGSIRVRSNQRESRPFRPVITAAAIRPIEVASTIAIMANSMLLPIDGRSGFLPPDPFRTERDRSRFPATGRSSPRAGRPGRARVTITDPSDQPSAGDPGPGHRSSSEPQRPGGGVPLLEPGVGVEGAGDSHQLDDGEHGSERQVEQVHRLSVDLDLERGEL